MKELVQLDGHWQDFEKQNVTVTVVSLEGPEDARATQKDYPHLVVVSDAERKLTNAIAAIHPNSNPHGGDTSAPTTLLIDGQGKVRWAYRPVRVFDRLPHDQLVAEINKHLAD
jgi:peroxiredoxin